MPLSTKILHQLTLQTILFVRSVFGDRIVSRKLCFPYLPDLNFCKFYLWGTVTIKDIIIIHVLKRI